MTGRANDLEILVAKVEEVDGRRRMVTFSSCITRNLKIMCLIPVAITIGIALAVFNYHAFKLYVPDYIDDSFNFIVFILVIIDCMFIYFTYESFIDGIKYTKKKRDIITDKDLMDLVLCSENTKRKLHKISLLSYCTSDDLRVIIKSIKLEKRNAELTSILKIDLPTHKNV